MNPVYNELIKELESQKEIVRSYKFALERLNIKIKSSGSTKKEKRQCAERVDYYTARIRAKNKDIKVIKRDINRYLTKSESRNGYVANKDPYPISSECVGRLLIPSSQREIMFNCIHTKYLYQGNDMDGYYPTSDEESTELDKFIEMCYTEGIKEWQ